MHSYKNCYILFFSHCAVTNTWNEECIDIGDRYQYLGNCPPTPPLTQQQSIDNKIGLMLG